jgi:hypothetical protein
VDGANLDFEIGTEMSRRSLEDEDPALDRVAGGDWPEPAHPLNPARSPDDEKFIPPARQRARQATAAARRCGSASGPRLYGFELKMPRPATCAVCLKALAEGFRRPCRTRQCCNWLGWARLAHPEERDHARLLSDGLGACNRAALQVPTAR